MEQSRFAGLVHVVGLLAWACLAVALFAYASGADVVALAKLHPVMLTVVILLACLDIVALMTALKRGPSSSNVYVAGLIATATLLPGAAILVTVATYLVGTADRFAPLWGSVIAVEAWLGAAYVCGRFAEAENAIPSSYGQLHLRLDQLKAALEGLKPMCPTAFENDPSRVTARKEAEKHISEIERDLEIDGPSWVLATGYAKVWERLYRAEEALIEVAPQETVLSGAMYDESRLQGSKIETRDELLAKLRQAVAVIDPGAGRYLIPPARVMTPLAIGTSSELPEGPVGTAYTQTLVATGGMPPYGWKVIDDPLKPDGLELSPMGVLSGTPKKDSKFTFTVRVTDSASQMAEKLLSLIIKKPAAASAPTPVPLAISTPSPLPEGPVGTLYTQTLAATGGTIPYKWKAAGAPAWLALDETTGMLTGTPAQGETVSFTVRVTDSTSQATEKPFTLTIKNSAGASSSLSCNTDQKKMARAVLRSVRRSINEFRNQSWNGLILARNHLLATMVYTALTVFVLLSIALIWEAKTSTVFAASVFYLVGATAGLCDRLRRESQAEAAIDDYGLSTARLVTVPLFSGLGAIGGVLLVAMLPFSSTVFGPRAAAPPAPPVLAISTPSPLTEGEVAKAYFEPLQTTGGTQPYKWTVSGGAIPDGLSLTSAGLLSGTPTNDGVGDFVVRAADSAGVTVEKKFRLPIKKKTQDPPLEIRTTSPLPGATVARDYSERLQATGGEPPYTWAVKGAMPDGLGLSPAGLLTGRPKAAETIKISVQVKDKQSKQIEKDFDLSISQYEQAPAVAAAVKPPSEQIPPLDNIFDLDKNLIGLLVAAVFGLTPGLLFDRLQQQADKYKADLKSSQATEGTQKT